MSLLGQTCGCCHLVIPEPNYVDVGFCAQCWMHLEIRPSIQCTPYGEGPTTIVSPWASTHPGENCPAAAGGT